MDGWELRIGPLLEQVQARLAYYDRAVDARQVCPFLPEVEDLLIAALREYKGLEDEARIMGRPDMRDAAAAHLRVADLLSSRFEDLAAVHTAAWRSARLVPRHDPALGAFEMPLSQGAAVIGSCEGYTYWRYSAQQGEDGREMHLEWRDRIVQPSPERLMDLVTDNPVSTVFVEGLRDFPLLYTAAPVTALHLTELHGCDRYIQYPAPDR